MHVAGMVPRIAALSSLPGHLSAAWQNMNSLLPPLTLYLSAFSDNGIRYNEGQAQGGLAPGASAPFHNVKPDPVVAGSPASSASARKSKSGRNIYFEHAKKSWQTDAEFFLPDGTSWVEVGDLMGNRAFSAQPVHSDLPDPSPSCKHGTRALQSCCDDNASPPLSDR